MAKFVFKLDGVLNLRLRTEQQAQRAAAERQAEVNRVTDELRHLNADLQSAADELRAHHLTGRVDVGYLAAHRRFTADVTRRGSALMAKIALAERSAAEAKARLAEAAKQRRILEILRDKQHARWRADETRRELAEADDASGRWFDMETRQTLQQETDGDAFAGATGDDREGGAR